MNEAMIWIVGAIGSGLIGVILAVIFDEPLRGILAVVRGRRAKPNPLVGTWRTTFGMPSGEKHTEVIMIRKKFGRIEGRIIPHADNRAALRLIEAKTPLRVEGDLSTSDIFSGKWHHPLETSRYFGEFQLILDPGGNSLQGMWLGLSKTQHAIVAGEWHWQRI